MQTYSHPRTEREGEERYKRRERVRKSLLSQLKRTHSGLQSTGSQRVRHDWSDWAHTCICSWIMTADCDTWEEARWVWKGGGLGKGLVSGSCAVLSFLLLFFFFWFYDCILVVARQHWLHLLEADVPTNLDFRGWKVRRMHYAIWKKEMKISLATFKLWISPELGSWRWKSFYISLI